MVYRRYAADAALTSLYSYDIAFFYMPWTGETCVKSSIFVHSPMHSLLHYFCIFSLQVCPLVMMECQHLSMAVKVSKPIGAPNPRRSRSSLGPQQDGRSSTKQTSPSKKLVCRVKGNLGSLHDFLVTVKVRFI